MEINRESVQHVAQLSKLSLSEEETARMQTELAEILEYMELLEGAEMVGIVTPVRLENVMRDDAVHPSVDRDLLLCNAVVHNGNSIVVPKAVE